MDIVYYGVVAEDVATFDLSQYFFSAAQFIQKTLSNSQSETAFTDTTGKRSFGWMKLTEMRLKSVLWSADKLLVHCVMGRSRSATLFLAYLMICENMTVVDAIEHVKKRRRIIPNWGFLKQLRELDQHLLEKRRDSAGESWSVWVWSHWRQSPRSTSQVTAMWKVF